MNVMRKDHQKRQDDDAPIPNPVTCGTKPGDLALGIPDPNGKVIRDIYWTTEKYQIYLADNEVRYILEEDYKKAAKLRKSLLEISEEREVIENRRKHNAVGKKDRNYCARMLARCMAQTFEGDVSAAKPILDKLEARLSAKIQSDFRMKYVYASASALILILAIFLTALVMVRQGSSNDLMNWLPLNPTVLELYARLCIFGALGAFLSVSIGIRSISFDVNLRTFEHIYAGGIRIIIGVIGAIALGLALDSKFLAPTFGGEVGAPVYYLMAFLAGFSETLVPNTLRKVEKSTATAKDQSAPNVQAPAS